MARQLFTAGLLVILALGYASCKKGSSIDFPVQSPDDAFNFRIDTISITTTTVSEDSVRTDELSSQPIGVLNDALIGKGQAGAFFQFRLPGSFTGFPSGSHIDSVVLTLAYSGTSSYYGNAKDLQTWEVRELIESMDINQDYYSTKLFSTDVSPLMAPRQIGFDLVSYVSLKLGSDTFTFPPHLRLKMDAPLSSKFLAADPAVYKDNDAFQAFFKGIYVNPISASGSGAYLIFDPLSNFSNFTIFYNDSEKVDLFMNSQTARSSKYTHDYSSSLAAPYVGKKGNFDTTFVAGFAGLKTKIEIGNEWTQWVDSNQTIAIHDAEVIIRTNPLSTSAGYSLPGNLLLIGCDSLGLNTGIVDQYGQGLYYGGSNINGTYNFNLARYFQQMVNVYRNAGVNNNTGLYVIVPTDNPVTPARLMLDTKKNSGVSLILKYSVVK